MTTMTRNRFQHAFGIVRLSLVSLSRVTGCWLLVAGCSFAEAAGDGRIAFPDRDAQGRFQIFTAWPDGTHRRQVTTDAGNKTMPAWSPDGTRIAYVVERRGRLHLQISAADGSRSQWLMRSGWSLAPAWSPDGRRIAFASARRIRGVLRFKIWVMEADGRRRSRLTDGASDDNVPTWSPDGASLAFTSNRDGGVYRIWVMNADGTGLRAITQSRVDEASGAPLEQKMPAWSPDGRYIAYWSGVEMSELSFVKASGGRPPASPPPQEQITARDRSIMTGWAIWVVRPDGTEARRITEGDDPAWSPDSRLILFPAGTPNGQMAVGAATLSEGARRILFTVQAHPMPARVAWSSAAAE